MNLPIIHHAHGVNLGRVNFKSESMSTVIPSHTEQSITIKGNEKYITAVFEEKYTSITTPCAGNDLLINIFHDVCKLVAPGVDLNLESLNI